jgi:hypothetical protein
MIVTNRDQCPEAREYLPPTVSNIQCESSGIVDYVGRITAVASAEDAIELAAALNADRSDRILLREQTDDDVIEFVYFETGGMEEKVRWQNGELTYDLDIW